jgi:hypothetical protein
MGLVQIRQGFAFAFFMFFLLVLRRPLWGLFLASTLHTTFIIVFIIYVIFYLCRYYKANYFFILVAASFLSMKYAGDFFNDFGGRRVDEYDPYENSLNINYAISVLIYSVFPAMYMYRYRKLEDLTSVMAGVLFGLCFYQIFAYMYFPIAAGRVGYFVPLFSAVFLCSFEPIDRLFWFAWVLSASLIVWQISSSFIYGSYDQSLHAYYNFMLLH